MENYNHYILNIKNLIHNFKQIKNYVGNNVKVCAIVKANAYGHGIKDVCLGLKGVDFFGVANIYEAMQIRKFDKLTNILLIGLTSSKNVGWCSNHNVSITIASFEQLVEIEKVLCEKYIKIHLKINSGMNRIGFNNINEFRKSIAYIKKHKNLVLEGVFTHFATKQDDVNFIKIQHLRFMQFIKFVNDKNVIIHCCNSFATLKFKEFHYGMVRCGFNFYGWERNNSKLDFKPIMKIVSKIISVNNVKKGESVGYNRTFIADTDKRIGVVPIGYADGFDRKLSNNFKILIKNKWVPIIGLVCMDICFVDLTNFQNLKVGDDVVIIGNSNKKELSPYIYANKLNRTPYEILLQFRYDRMKKIVIKK